jgi:hypothetical protein
MLALVVWGIPAAAQTTNTFPSSGNAGVGTTSPTQKLEVNGHIKITGGGLFVDNDNAIRAGGGDQSLVYRSSSGGIFYGSGDANDFLVLNAGGYERFRITTSGNFGFGTASPGEKIEVAGNIRLPATATATSSISYPSHLFRFNGSGWSTAYGAGISSRAWDLQAIGKYSTYGDSDFGLFYNGQTTPALYILGSSGYAGNVGIGTTSPGEKMEVIGNIKLPATATATSSISYPSHLFRFYGSGWATAYGGGISTRPWDLQAIGRYSTYGDSDFGLFYNGQTTPALYILGSSGYAGNVGIGTTGPSAKLEVADSSDAKIKIAGTGSSDAELLFATASNGRGIYLDESDSNKLKIYTGAGKGTAEVTIDNSGNVGIGTNPAQGYKLDVNGNTNVTGNITASGSIGAKYQDLAEWVESSEQLAAGTVVVLDSDKSNQVIASSQAYDTRVAGVISAQPGITLGEKGDTKVLVATTGRVRIKVDASKSPIRIGDLLVTSDVPGVAMKSEAVNLGGVQFHRPGTLIGKALEPLEKGKGEILVLLSLQ